MAHDLDLLDAPALAEAAECLRVMGHPARLRIADVLMQGQFTVGRLAALCELPQSQASEHLRLLQAHGFLRGTRRGREVYYRIVNPRLPRLLKCIRATCGK